MLKELFNGKPVIRPLLEQVLISKLDCSPPHLTQLALSWDKNDPYKISLSDGFNTIKGHIDPEKTVKVEYQALSSQETRNRDTIYLRSCGNDTQRHMLCSISDYEFKLAKKYPRKKEAIVVVQNVEEHYLNEKIKWQLL